MQHVDGFSSTRRIIGLCTGKACGNERADTLFTYCAARIEAANLSEELMVTRMDCRGKCDAGPVMHVYPDNVIYSGLTKEMIDRIVEEHLKNEKIVADYAMSMDKISNRFIPFFGNIHFFGKQLRMTLRNCGVIDPEAIDEYLSVNGYEAAAQALASEDPEMIIEKVKSAGLKGRGGGGFLTAQKWSFAAKQDADEKFLICNADEGDPGAFMDRSTIEGDPHTIIEGMIIAGYAIGATKGFIYTRVEYPLAIKRLEMAIKSAREYGFLGKNIFGTGWDFDVEVRLGAGAFVCGEETALIKSIEGYRGEPKPRPPFPTDRGLWNKPTVINNVETFANVPVALLDGESWFNSIGTPQSKGTKVFALAGAVRHTGLIEVPMGTTLHEVIYTVGGGIPENKKFKAVQIGGPAGGCLPESFLETPVDYDSLKQAGAMMGSGGMIVMDESTCMVDVARFFLEFMAEESCGQCTPCRAGTTIMLEILDSITKGKATMSDLDKLEEIAKVTANASLCGLGKGAPNPVLSTLSHFRHEYEEHIVNKRCSAGVCKSLTSYIIDREKCVGCTACARVCPVKCIVGAKKMPHEIINEICVKCGSCYDICKFNAVQKDVGPFEKENKTWRTVKQKMTA
ncbi:MAG: NADH-quinone oxidoreductase subunit F [Chitinivibrionales bacterium]|nr:NADH-quinone oxidoreductase subunit F [Chitinivibrionales bacterium]